MSKPEYHSDQEPSALEQMSTASLEKLLLLDFYGPEDGESDMGRLYHAAQLLAQRGPQPAVDRAWETFQETYLPFAGSASPLCEDGSMPSSRAAPGRLGPCRRWLRAALAAAAQAKGSAECAVSGGITMEELKQMIDSICQ